MKFDFDFAPITDMTARMSALTGSPLSPEVLSLDKIRAAMNDGVMVRVRISSWTGEVTLDKMDSANLFNGDSYISGAKIQLLANKETAAIKKRSNNVKQCLNRHAFKIEGYSGHFLPAERWHNFKADFNEARADLIRAGITLSDRWESLREQSKVRLARIAKNAWPNYRSDWNDLGEVAPGTYASHDSPPEFFCEYITEKYASKIPHPDVMLTRFDASYTLSVLYVPELQQQLQTLSKYPELVDSLNSSLEVQRNGLPYQFAAAVLGNLMTEVQLLRENLALERPNLRLSAALGMCARFSSHWHKMNIIADARLKREIHHFDVGLKKIAARTNVKKHVSVEELMDLVTHLATNVERLHSKIKVA